MHLTKHSLTYYLNSSDAEITTWSYCMLSSSFSSLAWALLTAGYLDGLQLDSVNRSICSDAARVSSGIEKIPAPNLRLSLATSSHLGFADL